MRWPGKVRRLRQSKGMTMKLAPGLGFGLILLAGLGVSSPGRADGIPQGTYLDTCNDARVEGASLMARCRGADGMEHRSALVNFDRCVGDIGNNDGALSCNMGIAGRLPAPAAVSPPVSQVVMRCDDLHHEVIDLRQRRDATADPILRAQIEGRLHGAEDQEEHCAP
jgi:hypothetical protein